MISTRSVCTHATKVNTTIYLIIYKPTDYTKLYHTFKYKYGDNDIGDEPDGENKKN